MYSFILYFPSISVVNSLYYWAIPRPTSRIRSYTAFMGIVPDIFSFFIIIISFLHSNSSSILTASFLITYGNFSTHFPTDYIFSFAEETLKELSIFPLENNWIFKPSCPDKLIFSQLLIPHMKWPFIFYFHSWCMNMFTRMHLSPFLKISDHVPSKLVYSSAFIIIFILFFLNLHSHYTAMHIYIPGLIRLFLLITSKC